MGYIPQKQRLVHADRELEVGNGLKIADYNLKDGSTIHLIVALNVVDPIIGGDADMQIYVCNVAANNKSITLDVKPSYTVEKLKEKILAKTQIHPDTQKLSFKGIDLEVGKNHTLASYNIKNEEQVMLNIELLQIFILDNNNKSTPIVFSPGDTIE